MSKKLIIHTDGGSRGNPGIAGAGVVIAESGGENVYSAGFFLGKATNNVAEYAGLVRGLEAATKFDADEVAVFLDSKLLVEQINGRYKVKSAGLRPLYEQAKELLGRFKRHSVEHVYREHNSEADKLANQAMDGRRDVGGVMGKPIGNAGTLFAGNDEKADGIVLAKIELREMVSFDKNKPIRLMLSKEDEFYAGLICLEAGQKHSAKLNCEQATVTVMRGRGQLDFGGKSHDLRAGVWLHLSNVSELSFAADEAEQLVVILSVVGS